MTQRNALPQAERADKSQRIFEKLRHLDAFEKSRTILCYLNFGSEVATLDFVELCLGTGKRIAVPKVLTESSSREMAAFEIKDLHTGLIPGAYGILEPEGHLSDWIRPDEPDLVVIPGVAFDLACRRVGYGGGYYDRYLPKMRQDCLKAAVAFELQVLEEIPGEAHDQIMDMVITEQRIVWGRKLAEKGCGNA